MDKQNSCCFVALIAVTCLLFLSISGCLSDDITDDQGNTTGIAKMSYDNDTDLTRLTVSGQEDKAGIDSENTVNETPVQISLKRTAVLELDNGYSIKVLKMDKQKKQVQVSLRKDDNEYNVLTLLAGSTYGIKDSRNENIIYDLHIDRIFENDLVVELTYTLKPEILIGTGKYEGEVRISDLKISEDTITRTYRWNYRSSEFIVDYEYNIGAYDTYSKRSRDRAYASFINDPYDDELISQITSQMGELADGDGYGKEEIPYIAMAFVQSLPYVSDSVSAGYDDYPRFPFETLYHGGGDCEDSSILLASMLYEMGYGVALIELPGHMAVGVKGEGLEGSYYDHANIHYYYLETTNSGWDIGVNPDEYASSEVLIMPVLGTYPEPKIGMTGSAKSNGIMTYVDLDIGVENVGSSVAEDVVIYATIESTTKNMMWDELRIDTGSDLAVDESTMYTVSDMRIPAGELYRVGVWAWGQNAEYEYVYSEWVTS